jgi:hypothetical protein
VVVAHGAAATDSGARTPTVAKTNAANGKAIATDRIFRISFLHRGLDSVVDSGAAMRSARTATVADSGAGVND